MEKKLNFTRNFHLKTSTTPQKCFIGVNRTLLSKGNFAQLFSRLNSKFKKEIIVLFLVFGFSITQSFAQRDQITTQAGEKIRCRILDETPNRFIYAYLSPAGKVLRNEIFKNLVSEFKYNFYLSDIVTKGNKLPEGLGGAREENTNAPTRVDTRKSEQPSKQSDKTVRRSNDAKKETKKTDEKVADKEQSSENIIAQNNKESENKTTKTNKKEGKVVSKTTETPKITPEKESQKPVNEEKAPKVKEEKTVTPMDIKKDNNEFSNYLKWRVGVRGGFGNMLAKIETKDEFSLYQEKLLRGWTWGADASYFFGDNFGLGLMFNNFQSQNKAENIDYKNIITNENVTKGSLSNKRSTKFVGPVMYFRRNIDFKTMVILGLSPGAYLYSDKGTYNNSNYKFKGLDFGAAATLGVDFLLGNDITGRDIILSLEAGYNYGKMRAIDLGVGNGAVNLSTPINLSRVDFTVGLRFTRYPKYFR
ncbi:hypothetical protein [Emticicia sp.]|uniref:hypothetical protein n=1 Tax=Emticicia sp. TaxID=1930953 RepID=UPI00375365EB